MTFRPNDAAGPKGVATLLPGQRRRYRGVHVQCLKTGGYSLAWLSDTRHDGYLVWYRHASDAVTAIQLGMPVDPEVPTEPIAIGNTIIQQPNMTIIKEPNR